MSRSDYVALVTEPAAEYLVRTDLARFGLTPYLPQIKRRSLLPHAHRYQIRLYPLFPRYILLPLRELDRSLIRTCRGICRTRPLLADSDGRPWRAPEKVVFAVRAAEEKGDFDENLMKGDKVRITDGVLANISGFLEDFNGNTAQILTPLFGNVKVTIARNRVTKAD